MLGEKDAVGTVAVRDLPKAIRFYEETLGLKRMGNGDEAGVATYRAGSSSFFVYESEFAGTNKATALTWPVEDVDGTVRELREKGVTFEHYDLPDMTRQGDVHVAGEMRAAWFKDPDGNIHALVNG